MTQSDEFAYVSATDLAARIRRRELSPVELMDAVVQRIEARNPSLNAFVFTALRRGAGPGEGGGAGADVGRGARRRCTVCPTAMKDCSTSSPAGRRPSVASARSRSSRARAYCAYAGADGGGRSDPRRQDQQPGHGLPRRDCDNYLFGPTPQPLRPVPQHRRLLRRKRRRGGRRRLLPLSEGTDGGGSIRIPAGMVRRSYGFKASFGRVPWLAGAPERFRGPSTRSSSRGAVTRTVDDAALALDVLGGYDERDPFCAGRDGRFRRGARAGRSRVGRIAYSPDFGVFPVDPRVAAVGRGRGVTAFEEAGAIVEEVDLHLQYDQRELSDLWCRLIAPLNVQGVGGHQQSWVSTCWGAPRRLPARGPAMGRRRATACRPGRDARPGPCARTSTTRSRRS